MRSDVDDTSGAMTFARRSRVSSEPLVPIILLVGGCLNGFAARLFEAWASSGALPLFAVSPIEMFALFVAASGLLTALSANRTADGVGAAEVMALAGMLVPSSTVAWIATGGYALWLMRRARGDVRTAAALFLGLALTSLWAATLLKWLTLPITSFEAWTVGLALGLLRSDIVQTANIVGTVDGHSLVILTACSALDALPRVLLGIAATAVFLGPLNGKRLLAAMAVATVIVFIGNEIRLLLMTWSANLYDWVHGPIGANIYDGWQVLLVLAAGVGANRK